MKKMIGAFAALAAGVTFAEGIASANVVGYDTETTRANYNYVIPTFRTTGGDKTATDIQQLQLSDAVSSWDVTFQFLQANRRSAEEYTWIDATEAKDYNEDWPDGQGLWINEDTVFPPETVLIAVGNSVQLDMGENEDVALQCAGQVSDEDLTYTTRAGYNYVGNPFPTNNSIQNIQLEDGLDSWGITFQFLQANRRSEHEYTWINADEAGEYAKNWPAGLGLWVDSDTSAFPEDNPVLAPGQAVQLDMGEEDGYLITVYAPIEI